MKRRIFLTHCAGAAAGVLLPTAVMASRRYARGPSRELFAPLIGQSFRGVDEDNLVLNFELLEVVVGRRTPGVEQFRLVFRETYLKRTAQSGGLYRMFHPDTGAMLLRLDPSVKGPRMYLSIFSVTG